MDAFRIALIAGLVAFGSLGADRVFAAESPAPQRLLGVVFVRNDDSVWFLHPAGVRYPLSRPSQALALMKERGVGISDADLSKIPTGDETVAGDRELRARLAGHILLQVESHGEAWFVNPNDRKRYPLGKPEDALALFQAAAIPAEAGAVAEVPEAGAIPDRVVLNVPFVAQAPFGNWRDIRQEEGCEEASVLMAMHWARNQTLDRKGALDEILKMADYETRTYGYHNDTSAADTMDRLFREYFRYDRVELKKDIDSADIRETIAGGNPVIVPVNGMKLHNPHFGAPGPRRHMVLVIGYDDTERNFLVHDPGTRFGASHEYPYDVMDEALEDYPSGIRRTASVRETAMIVVHKDAGR